MSGPVDQAMSSVRQVLDRERVSHGREPGERFQRLGQAIESLLKIAEAQSAEIHGLRSELETVRESLPPVRGPHSGNG